MSVPNPAELTAAIASKAGVEPERVASVLKAQGVSLAPIPPATRSLDIRRLSFSGTRSGTRWDGKFEKTFDFPTGVTALITDQNLRGKSSVLELITWALRGEPRKLRSDVKPWFERIVLEYSVNGIASAVVLTKGEAGMVADILRGKDPDVLRRYLDGEGVSENSVHLLAGGLTETEFKDHQDQQMMSLLSLEPITNFQSRRGSDQGDTRENRWKAYFGGIYLPPASSDALFGDTVMAALPARILQMFCNVPLMSAQIRLTTISKLVRQDELNQNRRLIEDAETRAAERVTLQAELAQLEAQLASLPSASGRSYDVVTADLKVAEKMMGSTVAVEREARQTFTEAKAARQAQEFRSNGLRETELADLLFHSLSPKHCPRCERQIESQRLQLESTDHQCSVCARTLEDPVVGEEDEGTEIEGVLDELEALRAAEEAAENSATAAVAELQDARERLDSLTEELLSASRADEFTSRLALQLEKARLEGQIQQVPAGPVKLEPSESLKIIEGAVSVLTETTRLAAQETFEELNTEILDLGQKFGIDNLERIALNRQGGMKVTTAGVEDVFTKISGGERLRLRVATIIALLRVGIRAGSGSHPGLILLDSPGSDELTVHDEAVLLEELQSLNEEIPGLQVVVASAEPAAVQGHLPPENIYSRLDGAPLW